MPELQFTLHPSVINAVAPSYLKWLTAFSLASVTIYYVLNTLDLSAITSQSRLITALITTTLLGSILAVKRKLVHLHYTSYYFYDTHVTAETGIVKKKRDSMPYQKISKVINNEGIWDRLTNASDITLQSSRPGENQGLTLKSITDADNIEEKIYRLLKEEKNE